MKRHEIHVKNSTARNHDPITQDYPQTFAVSTFMSELSFLFLSIITVKEGSKPLLIHLMGSRQDCVVISNFVVIFMS